MGKMPRERFEKAKAFLHIKARGLESARFAFLFENGTKESVIKQLAGFQNDDGGFGHGIEPDFWLPLSSPMATWTAGQILMEIDADENEPMIQAMLSYLVQTANRETGMWATVLPENNDYPHAPWWHWKEGVQDNWMFNPSAELAAFLIHWSPENSEAATIGWSSVEKATARVMSQKEMDSHEINNFQQMVKILKPYQHTFDSAMPFSLEEVSQHVMQLSEACVDKDVSNWSVGYKPLPLDFIEGPRDPLCERLGPLVEEHLSLYVEQMDEDGMWDISWSWGQYPEAYEKARQEWKGILAVGRYKQLRLFGYLD
ncbi:hypothetical protein [Aureibacillus halotolerans]|nr:hypothetical protein [Aureibacillus halotolerans]